MSALSRSRPGRDQWTSWLAVTTVCFLVGLLAVMQFRAQTQSRLRAAEQALNPPDQAQVISNLVEANTNLRRQVQTLEGRVEAYETQAGENDLEILVAELNRMKLVNGLIEASGPGIRIEVTGRITTQDMQDLINELCNAGSEGIAINERRVVANSIVARQGEELALDGATLTSPYVLRAVGHPETLERAVERKGGLVPLLRYNNPHLTIQVATHDKLILPVYEGDRKFVLAQSAE